jgi:hypothetical protein
MKERGFILLRENGTLREKASGGRERISFSPEGERGKRQFKMQFNKKHRIIFSLFLFTLGIALIGFYEKIEKLIRFKPRLVRIDPIISFNWITKWPAFLPRNHFSIWWKGKLKIEKEGKYTFFLESDDGSRLWINGKLLIDNWQDHSFSEKVGEVHLEPGLVEIELEYYERVGAAAVQLSWQTDFFK